MNIIIIGDGKVGYTLAEDLAGEQHDVTVIDRDAKALAHAEETLDVLCIRGNGANAQTLISAGVQKADVLIAVTASDEVNMVCCLMGKQLGAKYAISRIRDPEYTESLRVFQKEMGIDLAINPERSTAQEISRLFRYPYAANIETFAHGRVEMVEFRAERGDVIVDKPIRSLHNLGVLYCAVERNGEAIIPDGNFVIRTGDRIHVAGDMVSITQYFRKLDRNLNQVKSAILIGGGHISFYLAKLIEDMGVSLRIIEINEQKCRALSESLKSASILCADGTDQEVLLSENIADMDAFVCLTDRDEENLLMGLFAIKQGVGKVVVKVNRIGYLDLIAGMGIDSVVSPKRTTANLILRQVRARSHSIGSVVEKVHRVVGGQVEAIEFTALKGAPYLDTPLSALHIRKGVLVAVIVRDGKIIIPFGNDCIMAGDTVIVMAKTGAIIDLADMLHHEL